ncbi:hypothetical protein [Adhaeribacter rhizoryzae]|uniref:STAS/SEC14 domain-containing protein n=1 Tax=Adhaeribacter rhizoryzae TaxID=2607907 RepID=A0A5M6D555_9BACT|nr:hypothetical protein [Adhaeribacter rhizoryzae]KAA5541710.1 hypothetical protein F0145_20315 [Adhaeribacter rhizoryzae]
MALKTYYESDFYRIQVDTAQQLLMARWLRPVSAKEVKQGGTKLYEVLRDTQVKYAVGNAQTFTALSTDAKEWMSTTFYQMLSQTKLKKLARVLPASVFHRLALESVVTRAEALGVTKFEVKNFATEPEALAWLVKEAVPQ